MSGGVDSSVAAALLARAGHEVIGLSMQLYDQQEGQVRFGTCCTIDDLHDARRVAARIGIPHYIVNFERQFSETVVSNFVQEYAAGRTPIPCVHCNGDLKFATLVARARGLGAELVATGHYARVDRAADATYRLRRGVDPARDQSYFLFTLSQAQLSHAMFPVGDVDKTTVREWARELELPGAPAAPGAIRDTNGHVVGRHEGVHHFTVGQRKGLGLSSPIPLYVVGIDAGANTVTVGPRAALDRGDLTASCVNWIAGNPPAEGTRITAQIRHRHQEAPARLEPIETSRARVVFDEPQSAVAPGQAVVFYEGDCVLGGGWID